METKANLTPRFLGMILASGGLCLIQMAVRRGEVMIRSALFIHMELLLLFNIMRHTHVSGGSRAMVLSLLDTVTL